MALIICIIALATPILLFILCGVLYSYFGWFSKFYHDFLEWHIPERVTIRKDAVGNTYEIGFCRECFRTLVKNSNGDWVTKDELTVEERNRYNV